MATREEMIEQAVREAKAGGRASTARLFTPKPAPAGETEEQRLARETLAQQIMGASAYGLSVEDYRKKFDLPDPYAAPEKPKKAKSSEPAQKKL